jgi:hypothetical protein
MTRAEREREKSSVGLSDSCCETSLTINNSQQQTTNGDDEGEKKRDEEKIIFNSLK